MRVQCDVCEKAEAAVMCCADEAALCAVCDAQIHAANKLAGKHQRIPLIRSSPSEPPRCDICQDKTGWFFCVEDRALLCRSCDVSIHSANAMSSSHKRFLITGVRIGAKPLSSDDFLDLSKASNTAGTDSTTENFRQSITTFNQKNREEHVTELPKSGRQSESGKKGSISDYLSEGIPGWHIEDFLNIPDMAGGFDIGSTKVGDGDGGFEWLSELSMFGEDEGGEYAVHEVPQMAAAAITTGGSASKMGKGGKGKFKSGFISEIDDSLLVPQFGFLDASHVKRKRVYFDDV